MTDLSQLIADLEAAPGASFDLDCRIADALEPERLAGGMQPAPYTASLDAASGLLDRVLPGWFWRCGKTSLFPKGWAFIAKHAPDHCDRDDEFAAADGKPATPAIALCVCILKAKQREWMR